MSATATSAIRFCLSAVHTETTKAVLLTTHSPSHRRPPPGALMPHLRHSPDCPTTPQGRPSTNFSRHRQSHFTYVEHDPRLAIRAPDSSGPYRPDRKSVV